MFDESRVWDSNTYAELFGCVKNIRKITNDIDKIIRNGGDISEIEGIFDELKYYIKPVENHIEDRNKYYNAPKEEEEEEEDELAFMRFGDPFEGIGREDQSDLPTGGTLSIRRKKDE